MRIKPYLHHLIVLIFFQLVVGGIFTPFAGHADTLDLKSDIESNETNISQILQTVIGNQGKILIDVEGEILEYNKSLPQQISELDVLRRDIYYNFNTLYQIYWHTKEQATENNLIAQQIRRFIFQLNELYKPLDQIKAKIEARILLLDNLMETLETINHSTSTSMYKQAKQLKAKSNEFYQDLQQVILNTDEILITLHTAYNELDSSMPEFWLNYYLNFRVDLLENVPIWLSGNFWNLITGVLESIFIRELPTTYNEWQIFFLNIVTLSLPFFLLGFIAYRYMSKCLPKEAENVCKKILKNALPYIVLGTTIQYASWFEGNRYQIVSAIGTLMLCFGQIRLSWEMFRVRREEATSESSPFLIIFILLLASYIFIVLMEASRIFSIGWFIFLFTIFLYRSQNISREFSLSRLMIYSLYIVLAIGAILTLTTGLIRVSFFIVLAYICFIMGSHQVESCLYITSLLDDYLPKHGFYALVSGLLLAIILPVILTVALLSPFVWMLAFPSGEYLISSLGNFHFNIGELSLNTLEILSLITVFYLVKSIIEVSNNYIDNTWSQNQDNPLATLATPVKTIIFFGLWGIFIIYVLQSLGFNLTSLAVILGGLSVGIGLGLQGFIQNTFSGFLLIFGQNIREGDYVEAGMIKGTVVKVGLRATSVRTVANAIVFIPNSEFINTSFTNWTHNGHKIRCSILLGVAYGSNLELVKQTILDILKSDGRIVQYEEMDVFFVDFASSSLNFEVRFWIYNTLDQRIILSDLRFAINKAFEEHNIQVPFPQTDIHINQKSMKSIAEVALGTDISPSLNLRSVKARKVKTSPVTRPRNKLISARYMKEKNN